ncbi:hypothetical protein FQN60_000093 [Etheostoma spectabile]|uniref:Uncharacterized protein n=1 Tax=Etheostoma spectabile TaxID=54343 RepID=A0A5J5C714_9PERO|nr:hypothetical protein FQN60_000093 [Etheostoma spectabile]
MHTATHTATHTLHTATHTSHAVPPRHHPALGHSPLSRRRGRPIENPYANVDSRLRPPSRRGGTPAGRSCTSTGSLGAPPGPGSQVLSLPVCGGRRVREPGAPPPSEPFDGRPRRAAPPGAGPVALADASHLPPPADGETLDPSSPLALALAARERALTARTPSPEPRLKHASASNTPIPTPAVSPEGRHKRTPIPTPQGSPEPRSKRPPPHPADKPRAANQAHHSPDQPRAEAQTHNPANIPRRASGAPGDRGRSDVPRRPPPLPDA